MGAIRCNLVNRRCGLSCLAGRRMERRLPFQPSLARPLDKETTWYLLRAKPTKGSLGRQRNQSFPTWSPNGHNIAFDS